MFFPLTPRDLAPKILTAVFGLVAIAAVGWFAWKYPHAPDPVQLNQAHCAMLVQLKGSKVVVTPAPDETQTFCILAVQNPIPR